MIIHEHPPPLAIREGAFELLEDPTWRPVLSAVQPRLGPVLAAVGRLECPELGVRSQCGTAWLVAEDVAVTNRHAVVTLLADLHRGDKALQVDFGAEAGVGTDRRRAVRKVLYIAPDHDVAFLLLAAGRPRGVPIVLAERIVPEHPLGVVGFPANEDTRYGAENFKRWFKEGFDRDGQGFKRLTLGRLRGLTSSTVEHDCTTLRGSSGGAILDLVLGQAIGLNFGCNAPLTGQPVNVGVPAWVVRERLEGLVR